jgi:RNA polymerase sigma factor (sigma-70 family)
MLGSLEEAEDAVQHAFTSAHGALLRDDREIRLKPWLYAIARNRCVSVLRARREHADDNVETSTAGLDAEVEQRAELRQLVADLQDLPEDQRAALVLSELRDLSHQEVAEILGCRVANVKGLVFRARTGLSERREAREASCVAIQEELSTAQGGALRRGRLRHHLRTCAPCSAYLQDVRHQRKMMAAILPVVPTAGLKSSVLAAVGAGGAAAGGGGAAAGGGLLAGLTTAGGATVAKVAVVGALVAGGGGLVGHAALDGHDAPSSPIPPVSPSAPSDVAPGRAVQGLDPAESGQPKEAEGAKPAESNDDSSKNAGQGARAKGRHGRAHARHRPAHAPAAGRLRPNHAHKPSQRPVRANPPKAQRPPPRKPASTPSKPLVRPRGGPVLRPRPGLVPDMPPTAESPPETPDG